MTYADQHRGMVTVADAIVEAARSSRAERVAALPALRLQLSKEVRSHIAEETALIRERRHAGGTFSAEQNALMARYHDELLVWRQQLAGCSLAWTAKRVAEDARGFLADFKPIRDALARRVQWEEQVFYPAILSKADLQRSRHPAQAGSARGPSTRPTPAALATSAANAAARQTSPSSVRYG